MKGLLFAILLVLLGIAFPIAWIIIVPVLVLLLISGILGGAVHSVLTPLRQYSSKKKTHCNRFKACENELFKVLVRSISANGYKVDHTDKETGLVTFKTGPSLNTVSGHEGSVVIIPKEEGLCDVQINLSYTGQITDWGDSEKIAEKIFSTIGETFERIETEEKLLPKVFSEEDKAASIKEELKQVTIVAFAIVAILVVAGIVIKIKGI